jgi:DNA-binding LacI/PurR family transcriptional regulator
MEKRVTLKQVAKHAGVHLATASRALRKGQSVSPRTRKLVESSARKLGYRPDPMMSALAAYRSSLQIPSAQGVLVWLDLWSEFGLARKTFPKAFDRACARASTLGWDLQEMSPNTKRLHEIMLARGISGVIVPPMPPHHVKFDFDWSPFSAVAIGHTLHEPRLHRVVPDQLGNMLRVLEKYMAAGFSRPGLFIDIDAQERTERRWSMAFAAHQSLLPEADRVPTAIFNLDGVTCIEDFPRQNFLAWVKERRPDVVITNWATFVGKILARAKLTNLAKPAVVGLNMRFGFEGPGMEENLDESGAIAVNAVVGMMHRRERGIPKLPLSINVEGTWRDGPATLVRK